MKINNKKKRQGKIQKATDQIKPEPRQEPQDAQSKPCTTDMPEDRPCY